MWKTILVPHDFSPSAIRAAAIASAEAKQHGGRILLLHVVELPAHFGPDTTLIIAAGDQTPIGMRQYAVSRAVQYLDELADRLLAEGVSTTAFVRVGNAADEINRFAQEHAVDTIVMGTHGRTGIRHLLAGSVAERIVRTSDVPVLTIRHAD
jgi:nucleotide-binding universal stress UspA family protein